MAASASIHLPPPRGTRVHGLLAAVLVATGFCAAIAPTLHWSEFNDSIENLTVATSLEMRRGGPWLVPELHGIPRLAKPPLAAWLSALTVPPETVASLSTQDPAARALAYDRFAREARLPALLAAGLLLLFAYGLGWAVGGAGDGCAADARTLGLIAACVCGTTLLVLRHARIASSDIQLALWVTAANFFLAVGAFRHRWWIACCGGGVALGLALMCKGPVALLQTLLPFGLFLLLDRRSSRPRTGFADAGDMASRSLQKQSRRRGWIVPIVVGLLLTIVVGGWWFAYVATQYPGAGSLWWTEVTRRRVANVTSGKWWRYLASLHLFLPWLVWLFIGAVLAFAPSGAPVGRWRWSRAIAGALHSARGPATPGADQRRRAALLGLLLLAAPLIVMSFSRDRWERYMLPMLSGGGLLAAAALAAFMRHRRSLDGRAQPPQQARSDAVAVGVHWLMVIGVWTAVAVAAIPTNKESQVFTRSANASFTGWPVAIGVMVVGLAFAGVGLAWQRRWRGALVAVTVASMALFQAAYYRAHPGRSALRPVADAIWRVAPDAEIYAYRPPAQFVISAAGNDLSIHLNRPLRWAVEQSQVPPSDRPQVFVIYRNLAPGVPPLAPAPGWQLLARPTGMDDRYVFIRQGLH